MQGELIQLDTTTNKSYKESEVIVLEKALDFKIVRTGGEFSQESFLIYRTPFGSNQCVVEVASIKDISKFSISEVGGKYCLTHKMKYGDDLKITALNADHAFRMLNAIIQHFIIPTPLTIKRNLDLITTYAAILMLISISFVALAAAWWFINN